MAPEQQPKIAVNHSTESRSVPIVYSIAALLSLAGLADAVYLTVMHVTGQSVLCGSTAWCSQVLASRYAQIGVVPVAALGVIGYFSVFSFAIFAAFRHAHARLLFAAAVALMFIGTMWLLFVQAFRLHQFCRFCLFSAAVTFLLSGIVVATPLPARR